jgi:NitT/TauT family transport system ATP-binding protein
MNVLAFLGSRWQRRQASGRETVPETYGERPRAQDPAASGSRLARSPASPGESAGRPGMREAVVSLRNVTKEFGQGGVVALESIDLEVKPGELVSLIGPSGCGKSTLLRIVGDLIQPSVGEVIVNGKPAHQARLDRDYGIVFQDAVLYDWRTVTKNIALPLEMLGWDRSRRAERVREMIELVDLGGFENHHPWQLSGGMQQRVAIARALSFDPPLLLMDEPFGALDEMTRERLNLELLQIWERSGGTILFVTHSISEAVFLSTRVVVISRRPGRITGIVDIDLPQPRTVATREEPRFFELVTEVRELLRGGGVAAPAETTTEEELIVAEEGL